MLSRALYVCCSSWLKGVITSVVLSTILFLLPSTTAIEINENSNQLIPRLEHTRTSYIHSIHFLTAWTDLLDSDIAEITKRKLLEINQGSCTWNSGSEHCVLSTETRMDMLMQIDNPVAIYIHQLLACRLQTDRTACISTGCDWLGKGCDIGHEAFRNLISVECLQTAEHFLAEHAGRSECLLATSEIACHDIGKCTWNPEFGFCDFDLLFYNHGLRTINGEPEGSQKVFDARHRHLKRELQLALLGGIITSGPDLLTWTPSPFDCPQQSHPLVCEYVDAFNHFEIIDLYCRFSHNGFGQEKACKEDPLCRLSVTSSVTCRAASSILHEAHKAAGAVLAKAIDDPNARVYELQRNTCEFIIEEDACTGNCVWVDVLGLCIVSERWISKELYRLVGETEDRTCQFITADVTTGCTDSRSEHDCRSNDSCAWQSLTNTCFAGIHGWINIALSGTNAHEMFMHTAAQCLERETETDCNAALGSDIRSKTASASIEAVEYELDNEFDESNFFESEG